MSTDFATFVQCAKALPAGISVLLRGPHGIGKSQGVFALGTHFGLKVVDKRLSQMSEGDLLGLPKVEGGVTKFLPPDWYMDACENPRVLFLDELNRATPEVMQAAFQIVLDRQLNGHKLHEQTRVFAAVNNSNEYQVNEMDPALVDRFFVMDLTPTPEDWITWATGKLHPNVVGFIKANHKFLDPSSKGDQNAVGPSRRSYERLNEALLLANLIDEPNDFFYSLSRGFIGNEAAIAFTSYVKNMDKQITAEDILLRFAKNKKKIESLGQEKWNICIDKLEEYIQKTPATEEMGKNLAEFAKCIPNELVVVVWSKVVKNAIDDLEKVKIYHKYLGKRIVDVFQDPEASKKYLEDKSKVVAKK